MLCEMYAVRKIFRENTTKPDKFNSDTGTHKRTHSLKMAECLHITLRCSASWKGVG